MATFKAEVYAHQKKQDGTYNIKIRVTQNQKKRYLATPWYVTKDDLTRSLKIKNQKHLDLTDDLIRTYRNRCDLLGTRIKSMTVDEVVTFIEKPQEAERWDLDIVQYTRDHIRRLQETGHDGNAQSYKVAINSLVKFLGREKVSISEKRALTIEQMKKILDLPYITSPYPNTNRYNFALDLFILSFALVGMNLVDLYYCECCTDGRITYDRIKTKNRRADHARISIKIQPEIKALVDKYRDPTGKRMFKFYRMYASMTTIHKAVGAGLKKIAESIGLDELDFYAARHTWATIAQNDAGVDKWTVHTALNHVDDETKITDTYIRKSWDPIDKANRKVLNLVKIKRHFVEPVLPKQKNSFA